MGNLPDFEEATGCCGASPETTEVSITIFGHELERALTDLSTAY